MENFGVNVVGGRVTGVGVAGFTLGGGTSFIFSPLFWESALNSSVLLGYSWLTNQHGLTVDTVTAYELVTPDGTVRNVTDQSDSDLFFALKVCMTIYIYVILKLIDGFAFREDSTTL